MQRERLEIKRRQRRGEILEVERAEARRKEDGGGEGAEDEKKTECVN